MKETDDSDFIAATFLHLFFACFLNQLHAVALQSSPRELQCSRACLPFWMDKREVVLRRAAASILPWGKTNQTFITQFSLHDGVFFIPHTHSDRQFLASDVQSPELRVILAGTKAASPWESWPGVLPRSRLWIIKASISQWRRGTLWKIRLVWNRLGWLILAQFFWIERRQDDESVPPLCPAPSETHYCVGEFPSPHLFSWIFQQAGGKAGGSSGATSFFKSTEYRPAPLSVSAACIHNGWSETERHAAVWVKGCSPAHVLPSQLGKKKTPNCFPVLHVFKWKKHLLLFFSTFCVAFPPAGSILSCTKIKPPASSRSLISPTHCHWAEVEIQSLSRHNWPGIEVVTTQAAHNNKRKYRTLSNFSVCVLARNRQRWVSRPGCEAAGRRSNT